MYTPKRHLLTPGQRGHSPQRHTAAGTAAPTTTDTGETVPLEIVCSSVDGSGACPLWGSLVTCVEYSLRLRQC